MRPVEFSNCIRPWIEAVDDRQTRLMAYHFITIALLNAVEYVIRLIDRINASVYSTSGDEKLQKITDRTCQIFFSSKWAPITMLIYSASFNVLLLCHNYSWNLVIHYFSGKAICNLSDSIKRLGKYVGDSNRAIKWTWIFFIQLFGHFHVKMLNNITEQMSILPRRLL